MLPCSCIPRVHCSFHLHSLDTQYIHYIQLPSGYKHFIYSINSLHSAPFRIQTLYMLNTFTTFSSLQDINTLYTQNIHYNQLPTGYKHFIYSIHSLHSAPFRIQTHFILKTFITFSSLRDTNTLYTQYTRQDTNTLYGQYFHYIQLPS